MRERERERESFHNFFIICVGGESYYCVIIAIVPCVVDRERERRRRNVITSDMNRSLILVLMLICGASSTLNTEERFFTFCPCMGRMGNQLEHYLQAFDLSLQTNRTLILPPFIDWNAKPAVRFVSFDEIFDLQYLRSNGLPNAVTFENFMNEYGDSWDNRKAFCKSPSTKRCEERGKLGTPGNYWKRLGIEFDGEVRKVLTASNAKEMIDHDVIVLTQSGFSFPAPRSTLRHAGMLKWSDSILAKATSLIRRKVPSLEPFVSVHIRAGSDFRRSCRREGTKKAFETANFERIKKFFEARTCFERKHISVSYRMCEPTKEDYINGVQSALEQSHSCIVYVASDLKSSSELLSSDELKPPSSRTDCDSVTVFSQQSGNDDPYVDLAVMAQGSHFIGNCVSSFTAIVVRERMYSRRAEKLPVSYWGDEYGRISSSAAVLNHEL